MVIEFEQRQDQMDYTKCGENGCRRYPGGERQRTYAIAKGIRDKMHLILVFLDEVDIKSMKCGP